VIPFKYRLKRAAASEGPPPGRPPCWITDMAWQAERADDRRKAGAVAVRAGASPGVLRQAGRRGRCPRRKPAKASAARPRPRRLRRRPPGRQPRTSPRGNRPRKPPPAARRQI
jgi:hypothetical protein